jgi:hypothetical protein
VSVLLRQPHGFEGIGPSEIDPPPQDLSVTQREDMEWMHLEGNGSVACLAPKCDPTMKQSSSTWMNSSRRIHISLSTSI